MFLSVTSGSGSYCGVKSGDVFISYKMIWQDVREAMNYVHIYVSVPALSDIRLFVVL